MSSAFIPKAIKDCCNTLRSAGYAAYPVGGCVRDRLMEREPGDWDVTTQAKPEQIISLFSHTIPTGIKHGTVTVILDNVAIEVTTFRRESGYGDSRHPDSVSFDTDLVGDLARRDFTINAMAFDANGEVIDPYGGQEDIKNCLIRAVGNAQMRFSEDALRILRGVRFAAQLGFALESETAAAMKENAHLVDKVAPERIKAEMEKILCSPKPQWVSKLVDLGVLDRFYKEWKVCDWNALTGALPTPIERWKSFCRLTGFSITELPVERDIKMAITHPEREYVKRLSLSGGELMRLGLQAEEIGVAQRKLAAHIQIHPEDNTPERLIQLLCNAENT